MTDHGGCGGPGDRARPGGQQLAGPLPSEIQQLSALQNIKLYANKLT